MVSERVKRKLEETINPAERQRKGIWMMSLLIVLWSMCIEPGTAASLLPCVNRRGVDRGGDR